jgi:predicted O-methyltransferase YrrM
MENSRDSVDYRYTNNWFDQVARGNWDQLIPQLNPTRILEIGSYEGRSACYLIDHLAIEKSIEIHCIDTWEGGVEHHREGAFVATMAEVESRFHHNLRLAIGKAAYPVDCRIHKRSSDAALAQLLAEGKQGYFDFIYIDGSHQAPDVLCDAVLGFRLLRVQGLMVFDDYLFQEPLPQGIDPLRCPKPAIDAFTNLYSRKLRILTAPLYQLFVQKLSD